MENMLCWKTFSLHFTILKHTTLHSFEFRSFKLVKLVWLSLLVNNWLGGKVTGFSVESPDLHISEIARHGFSIRGPEDNQACLFEDFFKLLGGPDELALLLVQLLVIIPDIVEENDE